MIQKKEKKTMSEKEKKDEKAGNRKSSKVWRINTRGANDLGAKNAASKLSIRVRPRLSERTFYPAYSNLHELLAPLQWGNRAFRGKRLDEDATTVTSVKACQIATRLGRGCPLLEQLPGLVD